KARHHSGSYRTFRHRSFHSASSAAKETQPQAHAMISALGRESIQGKQERGFDHEFVQPIDEETVLSFLDAGATARLLLVEDHAGLAEATQEFLQSEGLEVRLASTGREAL